MRPSAWADERADHWYDAWDVQVAYRRGLAEVKAEAKKTDKRAVIAAAFDEEDD